MGGAEEIKKHKFFSGVHWNNVNKRKLKPPIIPEQEFLLTTRTEPLQLPSRPSSDSSSEGKIQSDFDYFQGFSFVSDRAHSEKGRPSLQKLITTDTIRPGEKIKLKRKDKKKKGNYSSLSASKRKKKRLANTLPGLELSSLTHMDGIQTNRSLSGDKNPYKLELLKEQASKDNRNRTFISVGDESLVS